MLMSYLGDDYRCPRLNPVSRFFTSMLEMESRRFKGALSTRDE